MLRMATHAMGTRFEAILCGDLPGAGLRAAGEAAIEEIEHWHNRLSAFQPDSLLSHINRHAFNRAVRVDPEVVELLALARRVFEQSGGAFDPAIAPAMRGLGFHPAPAFSGQACSAETTEPRATMAEVLLDPAARAVRFGRAGLALDLGAIAKGFAVQRAAEVLRQAGVRSALVHGGTSSVAAIGCAPDGSPWRVRVAGGEVEHGAARGGAGGACGGGPVVELCDRAMSVSAPRGRVIVAPVSGGEEHFTHIVDPRSGRPTAGARTACVIADDAACADAWSTAIVVLGGRPAGCPAGVDVIVEDRVGGWVRCAGRVDAHPGEGSDLEAA
jgi:thiamine biosynthesis lipoprotein